MEKLYMIDIKKFYALGYFDYVINNNFIEVIDNKYKEFDVFDKEFFVPMKRVEENGKVKYIELITGKEFYPQEYTEEELRKLFPNISNWKKVYSYTCPYQTKDGSVRFIEGTLRHYDKKEITDTKLIELKLKKMYLENKILYKMKMKEQEKTRNLENKLKKIKEISR